MKHLVLSAIFIIALPILASADGAYKWQDADGNTHYGNNPPKNATNVEQVSEMGFSHYSGSKVIERYQPLLKPSVKQENLPPIPVVEEDLPEKPNPPVAETATESSDQAQAPQPEPGANEAKEAPEPDSFIAVPSSPPAALNSK